MHEHAHTHARTKADKTNAPNFRYRKLSSKAQYAICRCFIMFQAGPNGGNIYMTPGANGTVYIGHTDMLQLFQVHLRYLLF